MSTKGRIEICRKGKLQMVALAQCDGYLAKDLAWGCKRSDVESLEKFYDFCLSHGFGCNHCLVVTDGERLCTRADDVQDEKQFIEENFYALKTIGRVEMLTAGEGGQ